MKKWFKIVTFFALFLGIYFNQCFSVLKPEDTIFINGLVDLKNLGNEKSNTTIIKKITTKLKSLNELYTQDPLKDKILKSIAQAFKNNKKDYTKKLFSPLEKKFICWLDKFIKNPKTRYLDNFKKLYEKYYNEKNFNKENSSNIIEYIICRSADVAIENSYVDDPDITAF